MPKVRDSYLVCDSKLLSTLFYDAIFSNTTSQVFPCILFQLWSNSLVSHHRGWCLLVMFLYVPKRYHEAAYPLCWLTIIFECRFKVSFKCSSSWALQALIASFSGCNLKSEAAIPDWNFFLQVIINRDTLVELLAKHTGNVSVLNLCWSCLLKQNNKKKQ